MAYGKKEWHGFAEQTDRDKVGDEVIMNEIERNKRYVGQKVIYNTKIKATFIFTRTHHTLNAANNSAF